MIYLRPLKSSELESFSKWATDPQVAQYLTWNAYTSDEEMKNFLKNDVEPHPWFMAIVYNTIVVGAITLSLNKGRAVCRAELGYVLARDYWSQGIGTRAVKLALKQAFKDCSIDRIESFVDPENIASIKVCEKAGMVREGLLKNYVIHKGKLRDRYIYASYR